MANIAFRSDFAWGPANVEALERGCLEGLSASQIAARLGPGVTRNMVIGKARRMGFKLQGDDSTLAGHRVEARLGRRVRQVRQPRPPRPVRDARPIVRAPPPVKVEPPRLRVVQTPGRFVCLADLQPNQCKFPVNDVAEGEGWKYILCAADSGENVYCPAHAAIAYRPNPDAPGKKQPSRWSGHA